MLIAFTGCDGCGKSTQIRRAEKWLSGCGTQVHSIDKWQILDRQLFPECRFLNGSKEDFRECVAEMKGPARTLMALWPIIITAQDIPRQERECDVVLVDGYWMKVAAAELVYGASSSLVLDCVEQLRQPDLTLLFDMSPEKTLQRKVAGNLLTPYECGGGADLSHEGYLRQQTTMRSVLRGWADRHFWHVINAEQPESQVAETVQQILQHHLCARQILFSYPRHH